MTKKNTYKFSGISTPAKHFNDELKNIKKFTVLKLEKTKKTLGTMKLMHSNTLLCKPD